MPLLTILRAAGALLLPLCGWLVGDIFQQKTQAHLQALAHTICLLQRIRQEIEFRRADLGVLYRQLLQEGMLPVREGTNALQSLPAPESLSAEEQACFVECMEGLGRTEAEQECERLNYYLERFQDFMQRAKQEQQAQAGLPHKLGLAAGAVMALVFL